jgi:deoxyribodipyrimidine photolyase-related protein
MRNYRDELIFHKKNVHYYQLEKNKCFLKNLLYTVKGKDYQELVIYEIEDKFFEKRLIGFAQENQLKLTINRSPQFLLSRGDFAKYLKETKKPFMKTFYEGMRKFSGILMDQSGQPEGGKFSFDSENRKKIPKKFDVIQNQIKYKHDPNTKDVIRLVDQNFPDHPGESQYFWAAVNREEALRIFDDFIENKLKYFGVYEDAIDNRDPFLYHSILSPYLNIGFLTPKEIIKKIAIADAPLNSKEGLIRQIMGWREFVRGIYQNYSEQQEKSNFFDHHRKLTKNWYSGTTGILPLDDAIKKAVQYGYNHHIERLMIISNIMLLCEINPREVHRWFMEMYIDSSDWVMGPNVYGMAQFSDGGIFATKPYIAGSNYIFKMGHYKKDPWHESLDGLYWRFIDKNRDFFQKNYRMSMMVKMLDKMDKSRKERLFEKAESFIDQFTIIG